MKKSEIHQNVKLFKSPHTLTGKLDLSPVMNGLWSITQAHLKALYKITIELFASGTKHVVLEVLSLPS